MLGVDSDQLQLRGQIHYKVEKTGIFELNMNFPEPWELESVGPPALVDDHELKGHGMALGVDYTFEYEEFNRTLSPGQIVLIGTDGIWEMKNESGERFGKERLKDIIRMNASSTAKEIIAAVYDALNKYRGTMQPEDDITMVVIKVQR